MFALFRVRVLVMLLGTFAVVWLTWLAGPVLGQGQTNCSVYDPDVDWLESAYDQYSICYVDEYSNDVAFVKGIADDALKLMQDKYEEERLLHRGGERLYIMLVPEPNSEATTGATVFKCCYEALVGSGRIAQIPYLAPSHSDWGRYPAFGGNQLTPNNYHVWYITHEVIHAIQRTVGRNRNLPNWFTEGQAEYDGMFHTNDYNRTVGFRNLIDLVYRSYRDRIVLGQSLASDETTLTVTEVYFSASVVLTYLSQRFGEDIQLRLLKHQYPTFHQALQAEMQSAGTTLKDEFKGLRDWLDRCYANSRDCEVEPIAVDAADGAAEDGDAVEGDDGEEEPGTAPPAGVSLSTTQPQVGDAVMATVVDPDDGVSSATWKWERSATGTSGWSLVAIGGGLSSAYAPVEEDAGQYLRATATYKTSEGRTKRASAISGQQVVNQ